MSIYNLESFKGHIKEVDTERLVGVLEGIMLYSVENYLPVEMESSTSGRGCVYVINAGQGNTIKLLETSQPSSINYSLFVNNIQVDWIINPDFRKDFINKVIEAHTSNLDLDFDKRQACLDVLISWNTTV